jgi:hypothetical protein
MIIKHIHRVNLIKNYVSKITNNQTWVQKLYTLTTLVVN